MKDIPKITIRIKPLIVIRCIHEIILKKKKACEKKSAFDTLYYS